MKRLSGIENSGLMLIHKATIRKKILHSAKKNQETIYGARAMNVQLPSMFRRQTEDYDILTKNPKRRANEMQNKLDKLFGGDYFYSKPAINPGTHKVMNRGVNLKCPKDDVGIVDYTRYEKIPTTKKGGLSYERISHIIETKKRILKDRESKYRWEKDRKDLRRIRASNRFKRI